MGENQLSRLAVLKFVARFAERDPIRDVEPQFGIVGKGLDVMGVEIPAARIAAPLAGEVVTAEHVEAPPLVFQREPLPHAFGMLAVLVRMALLTAGCSLSSNNANLSSCFDGMGNTPALGRLTYPCSRHLLFGVVGVAHSLERGHSAAERRIRIIGRAAGLANSGKSIAAALIDMKVGTFDPVVARMAPLEALLNSLLVFLNGYADAFCSNLHYTRFASHANS